MQGGWKRDLPDPRDFTTNDAGIRAAFTALPAAPWDELPPFVDLTEYFGPIEFDERQVCSTTSAALAMVDYFRRRVFGETAPRSAMFVERVALQIAAAPHHAELDLRTVLKTLVRFGAPPMRLCLTEAMGREQFPTPLHFGYADQYADVRFLRITAADGDRRRLLSRLKWFLAAGFPVAFGFSAADATWQETDILFRPTYQDVTSGIAAVAVGYDDSRVRTTPGALRIRRCGRECADDGLAWLPYRYVEHQLAVDFWTACSESSITSGEFFRPRLTEWQSSPAAAT